MSDEIQDVLFVISYDSYADAAKQVATALRNRVTSMRFLVMTQDGKPFFSVARLAALKALGNVCFADVSSVPDDASRLKTNVSFLFFAGPELEKTIRMIHANQDTPPVCVSCFPGVVLYRQEMGFSQRLTSDVILINSRQNMVDYQAYCARIGASSENALLFGFPALLDAKPRVGYSTPPAKVAYIDQNGVPASHSERLRLAQSLVQYAQRFPERELWILCRDSAHNRSAHTGAYPIDDLLLVSAGGALPKNIRISTAPAEEILCDIDLCIGIASTVLVHAISRNIPTAVLGDFGWRPYLGNLLFKGSGLECTFQALLRDIPIASPSAEWFAANVSPPKEQMNLLVDRLVRLHNGSARRIQNDAVAMFRSKSASRWRRGVKIVSRVLGWR